MSFNKQDADKNQFMLTGRYGRKGYDWWWHNFTGTNDKTGEQKSFFIEYFLCNPKRGGQEPVLGQLDENKEEHKKPSYLMVKCGCWGEDAKQLNRFFGWNQVKLAHGAHFQVEAEDCFCNEYALKGSVNLSQGEVNEHYEYMSDAGSMSWELTMDKQIAFNVGYGTSPLMRAIKAFQMFWHVEGMKTLYSGKVMLDGESYTVSPETSYGYADKNWGSNFTNPWVWVSSSHLVSRFHGELKNSAFDIGGGIPKVFGIPLGHRLLGALYYEGKEYEYNFSKFWTGTRTRFEGVESDDELRWNIVQENRKTIMHTIVVCKKKDMLLINYEAPDGTHKHEYLWNGGTGKGRVRLYKKLKGNTRQLIDDIAVYNVGCEYGEYGNEEDNYDFSDFPVEDVLEDK